MHDMNLYGLTMIGLLKQPFILLLSNKPHLVTDITIVWWTYMYFVAITQCLHLWEMLGKSFSPYRAFVRRIQRWINPMTNRIYFCRTIFLCYLIYRQFFCTIFDNFQSPSYCISSVFMYIHTYAKNWKLSKILYYTSYEKSTILE